MAWVDEDDLVVLVDTVLVDPVGVQDAEVAAPLADTLLGNTLETALGLEVVDTLADGLAEGSTYTEHEQYTRFATHTRIPLGTCFLRLPRRTRTR